MHDLTAHGTGFILQTASTALFCSWLIVVAWSRVRGYINKTREPAGNSLRKYDRWE